MLQISKRKGSKNYRIRGTVTWGRFCTRIDESAKTASRQEALEYAHELENRIITRFKNGNKRTGSDVTFDECLDVYLTHKSNDLKVKTLEYINRLLPEFTGMLVVDLNNYLLMYRKKHANQAISTFNRNKSVITAIIRYASPILGFTMEKLPDAEKKKNEIIFFMEPDTREKLLQCYSVHARPIFEIYAVQGFREQELLQLDWSNVHFSDKSIDIVKSKNGETRNVPMHRKTFWILARKWIKSGKPLCGHVFLNTKGIPYEDTRQTGGGSPIRKAHTLALARFKAKYSFVPQNSNKENMRVHDWRHDWASRCIMAGMDLLTLQKLGGWKSIEMVQRYAAFNKKHEHLSINRI